MAEPETDRSTSLFSRWEIRFAAAALIAGIVVAVIFDHELSRLWAPFLMATLGALTFVWAIFIGTPLVGLLIVALFCLEVWLYHKAEESAVARGFSIALSLILSLAWVLWVWGLCGADWD